MTDRPARVRLRRRARPGGRFPRRFRCRAARPTADRRPPPTVADVAAEEVGSGRDDRVNVAALRDITDDSGGRTEIVRNPRDLDPATASIADELSQRTTSATRRPA